MSDPINILTDQSRLSRFDQWLFRLESALTLFGGVIILALVLLAVGNILGRWLFDLPINGYIDWVEQAMAFMAFLGIAYTQRLGGHIRMDVVVGRLSKARLWFVELVSSVLMLGLILVLIYGSYLHFNRAFVLGDSSLDIDLPTWPAKLVVPVALSFLALRLSVQIMACLRALTYPNKLPIVIPQSENPAQTAVREADVLLKGDDA